MHLFFTLPMTQSYLPMTQSYLPMTQSYLPMTQSFTQDINKSSYVYYCTYKQIFLPKHLNFHQCIIKFNTHDSIFILLCINTLILLCINPHYFQCINLFNPYASLFLIAMHQPYYLLWFTLKLSTASPFNRPLHLVLDPCYNTLPMPFISNIYLYPNCPALPL